MNEFDSLDFAADFLEVPLPEMADLPTEPAISSQEWATSTNPFGIVTRLIPAATESDGLLSYGVAAMVHRKLPTYSLKVQHELPAGLTLVQVEPPAKTNQGKLFWDLGDIEAGKEFRIKLTVRPRAGLRLEPHHTTTFHAIYSQVIHLQTSIVKSKVEVALSDPGAIRLGQLANFAVDIHNQGNATLREQFLKVALSDELRHPDGSHLRIAVPSLLPDERFQASFAVRAEQLGMYRVHVEFDQQSQARQGEIVAPKLQVEINAPQRATVREITEGELILRNRGTAAAEQIEVCALCPDGWTIGESSQQEQLWTVPILAPGEKVHLPFRVRSELPGEAQLQFGVSGSDLNLTTEKAILWDFPPEPTARPLEDFLKSMASKMQPLSKPIADLKGGRSETTATAQSFIVFQSARTIYGVPLESVTEVARSRNITPVPNLPDWLLGITNLRGDMVSVVLLSSFLGQDAVSMPTDPRLMVLHNRNHDLVISVVVDRVQGMRSFERKVIRAFPQDLNHPVAAFSTGIAEMDEQLVVLLDVEKLLKSSELMQFQTN
jgi:purine-binding chemotaxis protein CheW